MNNYDYTRMFRSRHYTNIEIADLMPGDIVIDIEIGGYNIYDEFAIILGISEEQRNAIDMTAYMSEICVNNGEDEQLYQDIVYDYVEITILTSTGAVDTFKAEKRITPTGPRMSYDLVTVVLPECDPRYVSDLYDPKT